MLFHPSPPASGLFYPRDAAKVNVLRLSVPLAYRFICAIPLNWLN